RPIHDAKVSLDHVQNLFGLAATLAEELAGDDAYVADLAKVCGAGSTRATLQTAKCKDAFVAHYALKALRRPATAAELTDFKLTYDKGLDYFLGRLLLQPRFFYRTYDEGSLVAGAEGMDATYQLNTYELLSKVTFFFWNRPPTDALYA